MADAMTWIEQRGFAIDAAVDARMGFVRRTYAHLLGELAGVAFVVYVALHTPALQRLAWALLDNFILYILAFFGVSLVTRKMLEGRRSVAVQYVGAGLWVVFLGLLVTPLAMLARQVTGSLVVLGEAGVLTGCVFAGLTAYTFVTKKDFSFLGGALWMLSWLLVGVGLLFWILGEPGGGGSILYSLAWTVLLGGWVLYDTSKVLHHRHVDQHVAASVDLLVDFVYMFIHIASILLRSRR